MVCNWRETLKYPGIDGRARPDAIIRETCVSNGLASGLRQALKDRQGKFCSKEQYRFPTTSGRMDKYAPILMERGLRGTIGKGSRSQEVKDAMREFGAVYFGAIGGAGVSLAKKITKAEVVAYEDLGTEAIRKITVEDFPVVVVNDTEGGDLYTDGMKEYEDLELARSLGVAI